jgi:hypothetical protein
MKARSLGCVALYSLCGLFACSGTDTGNPADDREPPGDGLGGGEGTANGNCEELKTELDPSATTALGFTGQALIDLVSGTHTESLAWLQSNVSYGPESGRSEITLVVEPLGAPRLVDREPRQRSGGGTGEGTLLGEIGVVCQDSMELDVRVQVSTAGGALAESVDTTVSATSTDFAKLALNLDLNDIMGSFEATVEPPRNSELTKSTLAIGVGISPFGTTGTLNVYSEFRSLDGNAAGQGGGQPIAQFPADNYCPGGVSVGASESLRGVSIQSALTQLNAASPAAIRNLNGAAAGELTLAFTSSAERVCANFDDYMYGSGQAGNVVINFPAVVALESSDGSIDGDVSVQITAEAAPAAATTIRAQATKSADTAAAAAALPAQFGIQEPVNFSGYDGGLVELGVLLDGQNDGGVLRAYGLDVADCVTNPPQPMIDPATGAGGVAGCRGTDRIPLWGVLWGNQQ